MSRLRLVLISVTAVALQSCASTPGQAPASLDDQLRRHLAAVQARNLPEIEATITREADLLLILPSGKMTRSRDEYLAFHRMLFANQDWLMTFDQLEVRQLGSYGHALYRVTFDADGAGPASPAPAYLALGFRLEDGEWRLVHDQNTRLADGA